VCGRERVCVCVCARKRERMIKIEKWCLCVRERARSYTLSVLETYLPLPCFFPVCVGERETGKETKKQNMFEGVRVREMVHAYVCVCHIQIFPAGETRLFWKLPLTCCHCAVVLFMQIPKKCTDLDPRLLYILT